MGLDTSHSAWHGGYISFNRWRNAVAKAVGIPLELMQGFYGWEIEREDYEQLNWPTNKDGSFPEWAVDLLKASVGILPIQWESLKPDPLHLLLHHSDCDGDIAAEHCGPIADRLAEVLPLMPEGDGGYWRDKTQQFIDGLRLAASANEPLEFH